MLSWASVVVLLPKGKPTEVNPGKIGRQSWFLTSIGEGCHIISVNVCYEKIIRKFEGYEKLISF